MMINFWTKKAIFSNKYTEINATVKFAINLSEKFENRSFTTYETNNNEIEKAIISNTGFYAIINTINGEKLNTQIVGENETIYDSYAIPLTDYNFKYIILGNFNDTTNKKLNIIINNVEYELIRKN